MVALTFSAEKFSSTISIINKNHPATENAIKQTD